MWWMWTLGRDGGRGRAWLLRVGVRRLLRGGKGPIGFGTTRKFRWCRSDIHISKRVLQFFESSTYHVVLDPVDRRIKLRERYGAGVLDSLGNTLVQVMLQLADFQNTELLERPAGQLLGELAVSALDLLAGS